MNQLTFRILIVRKDLFNKPKKVFNFLCDLYVLPTVFNTLLDKKRCREALWFIPSDCREALIYALKGLINTVHLRVFWSVLSQTLQATFIPVKFWRKYHENKLSLTFLMLICQWLCNWEKWGLKGRNGRSWSRWLGARNKRKIKQQQVRVMEGQSPRDALDRLMIRKELIIRKLIRIQLHFSFIIFLLIIFVTISCPLDAKWDAYSFCLLSQPYNVLSSELSTKVDEP